MSSHDMTPMSWLTGPCDHVDFISDLHLHASTPRTAQALFDFLAQREPAPLVVLGDLFELWIGDDWLSHAEAGFERNCMQALAQACSQSPVAWVCGNRDFLVGEQVHQALGWKALKDPSVVIAAFGRCLVTHGDAWCLSDTGYMAFRNEVRSVAWQSRFLSQDLNERLNAARHMREQSQATQAQRTQWADVDLALARAQLQAHGCQHLVHGHTHQPADQDLGQGLMRHVLSDWDVDQARPARAQVLRWRAQGYERINVAPAGL